MARRAGVFELTFEQHVPGLVPQRGENLACAGDELMELERQKRAGSRATPLCFRKADPGQECLKSISADFDAHAAIL